MTDKFDPTKYKLVPIEPTEEMEQIGDNCMMDAMDIGEVYTAMLAAAPVIDPWNYDMDSAPTYEAHTGKTILFGFPDGRIRQGRFEPSFNTVGGKQMYAVVFYGSGRSQHEIDVPRIDAVSGAIAWQPLPAAPQQQAEM